MSDIIDRLYEQASRRMTSHGDVEIAAAEEIEWLRKRCDWMLHNGGLWCNEWTKEHDYRKHGPLLPWLSKRIDIAVGDEG